MSEDKKLAGTDGVKGTEYYEREGVVFRKQPGKPVEIYQGGWSEYSGDSFKLRHTSSIIPEDEANEYIAENDAHWKAIAASKPQAEA